MGTTNPNWYCGKNHMIPVRYKESKNERINSATRTPSVIQQTCCPFSSSTVCSWEERPECTAGKAKPGMPGMGFDVVIREGTHLGVRQLRRKTIQPASKTITGTLPGRSRPEPDSISISVSLHSSDPSRSGQTTCMRLRKLVSGTNRTFGTSCPGTAWSTRIQTRTPHLLNPGLPASGTGMSGFSSRAGPKLAIVTLASRKKFVKFEERCQTAIAAFLRSAAKSRGSLYFGQSPVGVVPIFTDAETT